MPGDLKDRIDLVVGDITRLEVDAVVTAANEALCGGGGVDGAVHRAAGPELFEECRYLGPCPPGEARITRGYRLPARHVIHAVGPIWEGGGFGEADTLAAAYRSALALAVEHGLDSIAFPCISTGAYGFPKADACRIAVVAVADWLASHATPSRVIFCCFEPDDADLYRARLAEEP